MPSGFCAIRTTGNAAYVYGASIKFTPTTDSLQMDGDSFRTNARKGEDYSTNQSDQDRALESWSAFAIVKYHDNPERLAKSSQIVGKFFLVVVVFFFFRWLI